MQWKRFSIMLLNDKYCGPHSVHSREVHEVGNVVGNSAAVTAARHSAPLGDVVHPPDLALPEVDVATVLLLQDSSSRHQGVKVLSTVDLRNKVTNTTLYFTLSIKVTSISEVVLKITCILLIFFTRRVRNCEVA